MAADLPWLKLYTRARSDAKLDALSDREFRIWFKLLCLSAEHEPRGTVDMLDPELTAVEVRSTAEELTAAVARMVRLKLVEEDGGFIFFPNFAALQYDAVESRRTADRDRQRRHRQKAVTPVSRDGHARHAIEGEVEEEGEEERACAVTARQPVDNSRVAAKPVAGAAG